MKYLIINVIILESEMKKKLETVIYFELFSWYKPELSMGWVKPRVGLGCVTFMSEVKSE